MKASSFSTLILTFSFYLKNATRWVEGRDNASWTSFILVIHITILITASKHRSLLSTNKLSLLQTELASRAKNCLCSLHQTHTAGVTLGIERMRAQGIPLFHYTDCILAKQPVLLRKSFCRAKACSESSVRWVMPHCRRSYRVKFPTSLKYTL